MRHVGTLALIASSAAAAGGAAWLARDKFSRISRGTCANPAIRAGSSDEAGRIQRVAARFRRIWPELTGDVEIPKAALEIALAQAALESGIAEAGGGGWWKDKSASGGGDMRGSGNLGARQCGANDEGGDYYTCVEYGDSRPNPDGTQTFFPAKFRYYKAGTCGGKQRDAGDCAAWDFLYSITRQWPAITELRSGDVLAYSMRQGPKYRGGDPPNQKVFGREYKGGNGYYGGFGATMEERVGGYVRAIASHLPTIAHALGHDRIYACIPPEVAGGGKAHAAVSGISDLGSAYQALDSIGALARARVIPGSGGAAIVWYMTPPRIEKTGDAMNTNDILAALKNGKQLPEPTPVGGIATTAAIAVASAGTAAVVGAGIEHYLKKKEKEKEVKEAKAAAPPSAAPAQPPSPRPIKLPRQSPPVVAAPLPELDTDRGSLAALRALTSRPPAQSTPSPATTASSAKLPALEQDRGSIAAQSSKLTREDMKQMFPMYTDAQIDDALKQLNGVIPDPPLRLDLARLAALDARDSNDPDERMYLSNLAAGYLSGEKNEPAAIGDSGDSLESSTSRLADQGKARVVAKCGMGANCDDMLRSACFHCDSTTGYAKCGNRECVSCGKPWFGPTRLSGEEHVTKESAAESDAYMVAHRPGVEGAGKVIAIAAGTLAAGGAAVSILYEREHRMSGERGAALRRSLQKYGLDVMHPNAIPAGYEPALGSYSMDTEGFGQAMNDYVKSLNPIDRLMPSGNPDKVLGWLMKDGSVLVRKTGAKVEGVGIAVAVTAAGLAAGVGLAALLSSKGEAAAPAPAPLPPPPPPPPSKPAAPVIKPPPAGVWSAPGAAPLPPSVSLVPPSAPIAPEDSGGDDDIVTVSRNPPKKTYHPPEYYAQKPPVSGYDISDVCRAFDVGAKKDEPDDVDKALATGSDVADVATGLFQAVAAGKKIAERGMAQEDPKCRKAVKAYVEQHPVLSQVLRMTQAGRDLRALSGINIGEAERDIFVERYTDELLRQRAESGVSCDGVITAEEDESVLVNLGARKSDFEVFTESLSHWAPDKVLPAAAAAFKTGAPAAKGLIPGAQLSDLSSLLTQQQAAPPPPPPAPPPEKSIGAGTVAAIAAGAAAAAAILVAVIKR